MFVVIETGICVFMSLDEAEARKVEKRLLEWYITTPPVEVKWVDSLIELSRLLNLDWLDELEDVNDGSEGVLLGRPAPRPGGG